MTSLRFVRNALVLVFVLGSAWAGGGAPAGEVDPAQQAWFEKYKTQNNAPDPAAMLLNTEAEPDLTQGFVDLLASRSLDGWTALGGTCTFAFEGDELVGRCVKGSPSTYLCSDDDTWSDLVLTCETFWEEDGNTGVMLRAKTRPKKNAGPDPAPQDIDVYGPQVEMEGFEGFAKGRGWSGALYGQGCGGYWYPLWLKDHAAARGALKQGQWNRMTLHAQGNVVKTWINGVPAAHWIDDGSYPQGRLGFQIHRAKNGRGVIRWRNVMVKRLNRGPSE